MSDTLRKRLGVDAGGCAVLFAYLTRDVAILVEAVGERDFAYATGGLGKQSANTVIVVYCYQGAGGSFWINPKPFILPLTSGHSGVIRACTRVVGSFPDGNSALMLVCARLRHVAGTQWDNKKYINMKHLETAFEDASIAG